MDKTPTKLEILSFISDQDVVWIETLSAYYGYTYWGAASRLKRLCKAGLVEPLYRRGLNQGRYLLTNKGIERIKYLTENDKSKQQAEQVSQLQENELENQVRCLSQRVRELERDNEILRKQNEQLIILHRMRQSKRSTQAL